MAKDLPDAWLTQAWADFAAAGICYRPDGERTACHAIAKYQQTVEKAVKAMVATLNDKGIMSARTGFSHEVDKLVSMLVHLPYKPDNKDIQSHIFGLLNEYHRGEIKAICQLAPRKPGPGELYRRNTEYPYQNADQSRRAPAHPGSFDRGDVQRFSRIAERIIGGSAKIVSALYR